MVLPICQRVMYWTLVAPGTALMAAAGCAASVICIVTSSVEPLCDRLSLLEVMSNPAWFTPPITGYRASPDASARLETGAFDGPLTFVPNSPGPADCRAIVMTPAPQWSATWTVHVLGAWTSLFEVSS